MASQFCDIRALAIASARHEKAANLALEDVGKAGNAARTPVTDYDVSLCDEIAKAVFCPSREGSKQGILTLEAAAQKPKSKMRFDCRRSWSRLPRLTSIEL
jgi:hypothetical protein